MRMATGWKRSNYFLLELKVRPFEGYLKIQVRVN